MNKKTKVLIQIAVFAIFIAAAVFAYGALSKKLPGDGAGDIPNGEGTPPDSGKNEKDKIEAPDFTVFDADEQKVRLSDFFGKPIVLNFWASWCPPCKGEMPEFEEAYRKEGGEVAFVMVDLVDGGRETAEKGAQYVREQGFTFPVYFDTGQEAAARYGIGPIPQTLFIDKEGYIAARAEGRIDAQALQRGIDLIK